MHQRHFRHGPRGLYARKHSLHRRGGGGPRARRGDVRAAILALLAERPMHGYEMIQELEERTGGAWKPSAGSVYPTLQLLEDEGLIRGEEAEGKRRFDLTDEGRRQQEERAGDAPWEEVTAGFDPEVLHLKRSLQQLHASMGQVFHAAEPGQREKVRALLDETRKKVYAILSEDS
jgi:DNA-binding PadR family transcriptional regulator